MPTFSGTVRAKLGRKGIEPDEVELVLADPERDFKSRAPGSDRHIYSRHVGKRLLLVVVEPFDHNEVVTAYYPVPERNPRDA